MGYVFTPELFESGRIPKKESYRDAHSMILAELPDLFSSADIAAANVNGSTLTGDWDVGSDIDVLVITNFPRATQRLREIRERIEQRTCVPVEFVPVPRMLAESGMHTIDYNYAQYLRRFCRDGVIGGDPFALLKPRASWSDPAAETADKFAAQLTKLAKQKVGVGGYDARHCDHLEKLMRQPIYAAIDMLRLKHKAYPSRDGRPVSKAECLGMYESDFPEMRRLFSHLRSVASARRGYRQSLTNGTSPDDYRRLLDGIDGLYPDAVTVLEANLERVLRHDF